MGVRSIKVRVETIQREPIKGKERKMSMQLSWSMRW